jgi:hypothetical protein
MVAPNTLFADASLYHNRAVPFRCPLLAAILTESLMLKESPGRIPTGDAKLRLTVLRTALLKPLPLPATSLV